MNVPNNAMPEVINTNINYPAVLFLIRFIWRHQQKSQSVDKKPLSYYWRQASNYLCWCGSLWERCIWFASDLSQILKCSLWTNTWWGLGGYPGTDKKYFCMLGCTAAMKRNMPCITVMWFYAVCASFLMTRVTNDSWQVFLALKSIHICLFMLLISKRFARMLPIVGYVRQVLEEMLSLVRVGTSNTEALVSWWKQINELGVCCTWCYDTTAIRST